MENDLLVLKKQSKEEDVASIYAPTVLTVLIGAFKLALSSSLICMLF